MILQGILLDSYKIRRTGWSALGTKRSCRPYEYQLPPNASSSEASRPATFTDALVECEEKYFHRKLLDFKLCYPARLLSRPVNDVLYLAALARNLLNVLEEEFMFRGSPSALFEIPGYEADIVNAWGGDHAGNGAAGDQGSDQDAHAEFEEDLTDDGSTSGGEESNEYDATSEYETSEPEGASELGDSEYESANEYNCENENTPENTTEEVVDNVHRWESDNEGAGW